MGLKVSNEFTVPLCRGHHRQLHQAGDEAAWWDNLKINALHIAKGLWQADCEHPLRWLKHLESNHAARPHLRTPNCLTNPDRQEVPAHKRYRTLDSLSIPSQNKIAPSGVHSTLRQLTRDNGGFSLWVFAIGDLDNCVVGPGA